MSESKLLWSDNSSLSSGTRHSSKSTFYSWDSIHEIIPGLFLTCESQVKDKEVLMKDGISLVINLCSTQSDSRYTVFHSEANGELRCLIYDQSEFFEKLKEYTSHSLPNTLERLLFVYKIPAEDVPTYDISQYFMECCYLLELCLSNRRFQELHSIDTELTASFPDVVVHCLAGISRSATVVAAYLMKKYHQSLKDVLCFMKNVRPVVSPNPGFLQQLKVWEACNYRLASNDWSAKKVGAEIQSSQNVSKEWEGYIRELLKRAALGQDRLNLYLTMEKIAPDKEGDQNARFWFDECLHIFDQFMKDELYVDIPNIFQYLCEIVASMQAYFMNFSFYTEKVKGSDTIFIPFLTSLIQHSSWREFEEARGSLSTALSSFLLNIHGIHFSDVSPSLLPWRTTFIDNGRSSLFFSAQKTKKFSFSFPFLPLLIAIAVSETLSLLQCAAFPEEKKEQDNSFFDEDEYTSVGKRSTISKEKKFFSDSVSNDFSEIWRKAGWDVIGLFDCASESPLNAFRDDLEVSIFSFLYDYGVRKCLTNEFTSFDQIVLKLRADALTDHVFFGHEDQILWENVFVQKIFGAILGFRLLLEVCEDLVTMRDFMTTGEKRDSNDRSSDTPSFSFCLADEVLSWKTVSNLFQQVHSVTLAKKPKKTLLENPEEEEQRKVPHSISWLQESSKQIFLALQRSDFECDCSSTHDFLCWDELLSKKK